MHIAHAINSYLLLDVTEFYLLTRLIICLLLGLTIVTTLFCCELVKFILTILKRNISPSKLQTNRNAHALTDFTAKSPFTLPNEIHLYAVRFAEFDKSHQNNLIIKFPLKML